MSEAVRDEKFENVIFPERLSQHYNCNETCTVQEIPINYNYTVKLATVTNSDKSFDLAV
jgi:hypothetical protein